jgi:hypothetical protein
MLLPFLTSLALAVPTSLTHQGRLLDGENCDGTVTWSLNGAPPNSITFTEE